MTDCLTSNMTLYVPPYSGIYYLGPIVRVGFDEAIYPYGNWYDSVNKYKITGTHVGWHTKVDGYTWTGTFDLRFLLGGHHADGPTAEPERFAACYEWSISDADANALGHELFGLGAADCNVMDNGAQQSVGAEVTAGGFFQTSVNNENYYNFYFDIRAVYEGAFGGIHTGGEVQFQAFPAGGILTSGVRIG